MIRQHLKAGSPPGARMMSTEYEPSSKARARLRRHVWSAMTVLAVVTQLIAVRPASAQTASCLDPHCYSIMMLTSGQWTGAWGQWHSNYMAPGPSSPSLHAHINSEMWFSLNNGAYLEEGLINGYQFWPGGCACVAYSAFWADTTPGEVQYQHTIENIVPDGRDHTYQISRGPRVNEWYIYYDNKVRGISTVTGDWMGNRHDVGGELAALSTSTSPASHADTFDMHVKVIDTAGRAVKWPRIDATSISPGFNGFSWEPSEWSWNKP